MANKWERKVMGEKNKSKNKISVKKIKKKKREKERKKRAKREKTYGVSENGIEKSKQTVMTYERERKSQRKLNLARITQQEEFTRMTKRSKR